MYSQARKLLFRLEPERAHSMTVKLLHLVGIIPGLAGTLRIVFYPRKRPVQAFGLRFANPLGLAAGYDKDGLAWRGLAALGFGHVEVGTVTLRPQSGNPHPRLFRLVEDQALINRMGFPGRGADFLLRQLQGRRERGVILGINLGKNKDTPLESAGAEYAELVRLFAPLADYLAINISSPNTVGLRRLQGREYLEKLLVEIISARQAANTELGRSVPLLVKLAPDLSLPELEDTLGVIQEHGVDGVIATNTTLERPALCSTYAVETGGLSGAPLASLSLESLRRIIAISGGRLPVIAVGGIMDADDAQARLDAGAVLVQIYTGLVYGGPGLVRKIVDNLSL